jgi:hypothetical protein
VPCTVCLGGGQEGGGEEAARVHNMGVLARLGQPLSLQDGHAVMERVGLCQGFRVCACFFWGWGGGQRAGAAGWQDLGVLAHLGQCR